MFDQAGLVAATASATNVTLSEKGWRTFFRGLANDGVQGPSVANYMKNTLGYDKVCVVDDSTDYGLGLAQSVRETLGPVADSACNISVKKGDKDFSAAVTQVKGANPEGGVLQRLLRRGGAVRAAAARRRLQGTFVSADGVKDPEFVKQAGGSAQGRHPVLPVRPGHRQRSPRSTPRSSARSRAPTAPRATTWAPSC